MKYFKKYKQIGKGQIFGVSKLMRPNKCLIDKALKGFLNLFKNHSRYKKLKTFDKKMIKM